MLWQILAAVAVTVAGGALASRPQGQPAAIALAVLSACWGLLLGLAGEPLAGTVQAAAGVAAAVVTGLSEKPVEQPALGRRSAQPNETIAPVFRIVTVLMGLAVAYGLSHTLPLQPKVAVSLASFSWYWLVVVALMLLLLGRDLTRASYGLLLLSIAGASFYALVSTQDSPGVSAAGAATTITLAVLLSYVRSSQSEPGDTVKSVKRSL